MPTLYIHIGHGKTGSSWIQACLRLSHEALEKHGILYATGDDSQFDHPGKITSGNAIDLLNSKARFEKHLKNNQNRKTASLLFSSEHIFIDFIDSNAGEYLEETARAFGFDKIKILLFIRNPIGMSVSIWQQRTKRRGNYAVKLSNLHEHMEIGSDMVVYVEDIVTRLRKCSSVELTVRNYSRCRERLVEETAEWLGIPESIFTRPEIGRINRSLTWSELMFQMELNKIVGPSGNIFSDPLCEQLPELEYESIFPPVAVQEAIWNTLLPYIERVNKQIPEAHRYQCDIQKPLPPPDQLTFSAEQIKIISESLGNEILRLQNPLTAGGRSTGILVTVVIPNYNYGRYLEQCIRSVLTSDFDPGKLEIILVDDASTDNSLEIAMRLKAEKICAFRIIANPVNLGVIRCRNLGIVHASGELLFFLDADNYLHRDCLKTSSEMLMRNPEISACFAPVREFRSETGAIEGVRSDKPYNYQQLLAMPYIDAMAMFRRDDLIEAGLYDTRMPPYGWEDYELWLRVGKQGRKVTFIPGEPLSFYRVHELNKSQCYPPDHYNQLVYYLKQKYGIKINFLPTDTLSRLFHEGKESVQLYYQTPHTDFSELNSLILDADNGTFQFKLPEKLFINGLRFDPFNNSVVFKFRRLAFLHCGKELNLFFRITSNAYEVRNTIWRFANRDPQIFIALDEPAEIDEVQIEIDFITRGADVVEEMEGCICRKEDQITLMQKDISCLQDQLEQKNAVIRKFKQFSVPDSYRGLAGKVRLRRNSRLISNSGFFDADFYLRANPDVRSSGMEATTHFLIHGGFEGRSPSANFDTEWYLLNYPDVAQAGSNPLLHYLKHGIREGRYPKSPLPITNGAVSTDSKLVSIIMTAYNAQLTIELSIQSLLRQTHPDLEIIVVDDGSNDNTAQIVQNLCREDHRVSLCTFSENRGCYKARNLGIRHSKGKYITFHDADDIALPDRIECQLSHLLAGKVRFVIPGFMRTKLNIHRLFNIYPEELIQVIENEHCANPGSSIHYELRPCLSMTMFAREVFEKHGLYWNTRFAGDAEFIERIFHRELGMIFNDKKNELRAFIRNENQSSGLYTFINKYLILSPEKSSDNITEKFPMGGYERERFKQTWKNRLVEIGDYEYEVL